MDKRYQVFVSSTFTDLVDERREVMQALLEMDCLPAGMELFPAADSDQWTLIQGVIAQSDYYLVILGGRYGSLSEEGVSYTEKEYDYAVELGIPVMGFVPADPGAIPVGKTDQSDSAALKLTDFQAKVQKRMTKDWTSAADLGSKVTRGLIHLIRSNPRPGWVRGDQAMTPETRAEIAELKAQIAQLEKERSQSGSATPQPIDRRFAHGDDTVEVTVAHSGYGDRGPEVEEGTLECTWDNLFEVLGPFLIDEAPERTLRLKLNNFLLRKLQDEYDDGWASDWAGESVALTDSSWGAIVVQFRALGLIRTGTKRRTVSDKSVYWGLTTAGDEYLVSLRAIPSSNIVVGGNTPQPPDGSVDGS